VRVLRGHAHQGRAGRGRDGATALRETPFFSARERAALAWTEAVTEIGRDGVSDALLEATRAQFSDVELANLTMAVATINTWNRLAVALGAEVGSYQPPRQTANAG